MFIGSWQNSDWIYQQLAHTGRFQLVGLTSLV